ncbi:glycerate kinase [Microcella daejeonensis]|uniref:glycerate kinase n=1 Tax=Microcella daejeonensis TaxID=2994971 RepID=UPI0022707D2A|nr:glycerate kinase [Microcella daejeonensis]WAB84175.1 glycerate kinase [Microcella daejeonensis]
MRVVLAPDSFKGSASAAEVVAALARGWASVRPDDELVARPMADGGEGTLDAFEVAVPDARRMPVRVTGPDSRPVDAHWVLLPATATRPATAVVELAATSGITLLEHPAPDDAHTLGFGEAIAAALDHRDAAGRGVEQLLLALGGSSSTDGGAGALRALGARLLDARGAEVPLGLRGLVSLATVDLAGLRPLPPDALILGDVDNPLLGAHGAAAVFGPQKGVADIDGADAALAHLASLLPHVDAATPGAGAAGGAGFGLLAAGAVMSSGSRRIAEAVALASALESADLVITGEGRFDAQTAAGKAPAEVARLAADAGVPVAVVAGSVGSSAPAEGLAAVVELAALAGGSAAAIARAEHWLEHAGAALARRADSGSFARS